jgi:hypothetical protein
MAGRSSAKTPGSLENIMRTVHSLQPVSLDTSATVYASLRGLGPIVASVTLGHSPGEK